MNVCGGWIVARPLDPLLDGNKTDLFDYLLTFRPDGEINEFLNCSGGVTISIIECRPRVRILFRQDAFFRRRLSINRNYFDAGGLGIGEADITHTICIFAY